jgi:hypothetical protein
LFDPKSIEDRADYDQPFAPPLGIDYVIVNGVIAVDHGNLTSTHRAACRHGAPHNSFVLCLESDFSVIFFLFALRAHATHLRR